MSAKRIFQMADGEEVTHIHLIAPDENLIITEVFARAHIILIFYFSREKKSTQTFSKTTINIP